MNNTQLKERKKRFSRMGALFIALALTTSGTAFLFSTFTPEEKEGFYMISLLFTLMGLVCQRASKK